jgi:hypothetical protein
MQASRSSIRPAPSPASVARSVGTPQHHGIDCPDINGAGAGAFEFETASGVYTALQCGS